MKVKYTHIVGVESSENNVRISFRPQGSDNDAKPVVVDVSPHDTYIHLSLSNIRNHRVLSCDLGGNTASLKFGDITNEC